jgi:hypothetical protein
MKILVGIVALALAMAASGCVTQVACEPPYIVKGSGCCLDQNYNRICDSDENGGIGGVKTYGPYKVVTYIQQDSPEPDSWSKLPQNPARNVDGYQIYSSTTNSSYFEAGWLLMYTSYMSEPITCTIREYHDSAYYSEYTTRLTSKGYAGNISGSATHVLFLKAGVPLQVRYDYICMGDESGITFQDAYAVALRP